MFDKLSKLKNKGYIPDIIFDIGANHGDWTRDCLKIYPEKKYVLIEPTEYDQLNSLKNLTNVKVFNYILNDSNKEVDWYEMRSTGDSIFRERNIIFKNCNIVKKDSITLNSLLENNKGIIENYEKILMKIDCQGAEIPILKGATYIYNNIDFIILELPFFGQYNENVPNFLQHIEFMNNIGFIPYEFLENHYVNDFNMQVDILFINKNHEFNIKVEDLLIN